jgi:hypothetical protein
MHRVKSILFVLALISVWALRASAEEVKCDGVISRIEGDKVTVKSTDAEQQLKVEPATKIIIHGKPGTVMDLKVGQRVKCLADKRDQAVVCTTLEVMRDPNG